MTHCILLNADYTFLNLVNWKRALCLLVNGKVQVLKYSEKLIKSAEGVLIQVPAVMKLIKIIRVLYRSRVPFSKKNVLIRDGFKCAYCGVERERLTVDHIVPKSRGGKTDFDNCLASCRNCNSQKGARTPGEAGMYPKLKAYQPTISEFLQIKSKKIGIDRFLAELSVYG